MKYVILIHSNPQPWGHPTGEFLPEHQALPDERRAELGAAFDAVLKELSDKGQLVSAEALADPAQATLFRWDGDEPVATDGPYAEAKEHLAGFFLIDVESAERAHEIARVFSGPGETVELRPAYLWPDA